MKCSCKEQCATKKGKGACKCREANNKCHDWCTCDKRECKNKVSEVVVPLSLLRLWYKISFHFSLCQVNSAWNIASERAVPITDGAERFEREIRNAETEIKVFCRLCHTRVFSRHNITTFISSCGFVWCVLVVTVYIFPGTY